MAGSKRSRHTRSATGAAISGGKSQPVPGIGVPASVTTQIGRVTRRLRHKPIAKWATAKARGAQLRHRDRVSARAHHHRRSQRHAERQVARTLRNRMRSAPADLSPAHPRVPARGPYSRVARAWRARTSKRCKRLQLAIEAGCHPARHRDGKSPYRDGKSPYILAADPSLNRRVARMFRCGGNAALGRGDDCLLHLASRRHVPVRIRTTERGPADHSWLARTRVCRFQALG